jgi:hypothetical protein
MGMPALLREFEQGTLQTEAVDLDASEDDRPLGRRNPPRRLPCRFAQRLRIARLSRLNGNMRPLGHDRHQIARQFDIARLPEAHHRRQPAITSSVPLSPSTLNPPNRQPVRSVSIIAR